MTCSIDPIGYVEAVRPHAEDDFWGGEEAQITLTDQFTPEALQGLTGGRHLRSARQEPSQSDRQPAWSHELMRKYRLTKE